MHDTFSRPLIAQLALLVITGAGCSSLASGDEPAPSTAPDSAAPSTPAATSTLAGDSAAAPIPAAASGLYGFDARTLEGDDRPLSEFSGQVTLVVNVASECGYTPQYAGLQALQTRLQDSGFSVLAFPSNEFGGQEPGSAAEVRAFCTQNYGVTFPLFEKCRTLSGDDRSPVYGYLENQLGAVPNWNFCKFLVGKNGTPVAFFDSRVTPEDSDLLAAIEAALGG
jgi:glutathione peroxidase